MAHEVEGHEPAGAIFVVRQQLLDIGGLVGFHAGQQLLGHIVVEVFQRIGSRAGGHLLKNIGGALLIDAPLRADRRRARR